MPDEGVTYGYSEPKASGPPTYELTFDANEEPDPDSLSGMLTILKGAITCLSDRFMELEVTVKNFKIPQQQAPQSLLSDSRDRRERSPIVETIGLEVERLHDIEERITKLIYSLDR